MAERTHSIVALFDTAQDVYHAAEKVRDAGFEKWDVYTPFPLHGLDHAMGLKRSKVPVVTFICGLTGFFSGMILTWFTGAFDYPLIVNGMPYWSWIFTFPVAYEMTILFGAFGTLFGMFALNRLPQHYHPVMNYSHYEHLTDDKFAIVIETLDPKFNMEDTPAFLKEIGGREIEAVTEE